MTILARIKQWLRYRFIRFGVIRGRQLSAEEVMELQAKWEAAAMPGRLEALDIHGKPIDVTNFVSERKEQPMGRFQVFKDKAGQWRWRLRSRNGRVVAQSEAYTRKSSAVRAVQAIDRALKPGYLVELPE